MSPITRLRLTLGLCAGAAGLLAACQSPAPPPDVTRVSTAATPTPIVAATSAATSAPSATNTPAPDTPTALPSHTATAAPTVSPTSAPTETPLPASPTGTTAAATSTALPTRTRVPLSGTATGAPTSRPAPSLYSTTSGPAGYSSTIQCQRAGAACAPVMPPGDVSFRLALIGDSSAPWTHFVNYGLSVEKDGANATDMFMFVDAGWLQPGTVVGFGASRSFTQPGTYVIRSSGCLTTDPVSNHCVWATIAGDVVTFTIQP